MKKRGLVHNSHHNCLNMEATSNGVRIYYEEKGTGFPTVFLHAFPLDHTIWTQVLERMKRPVRAITPDLRGHGLSEAPEGVYTMEILAGDVRALLDHIGVERAILVGHSIGGYVALAFARLYPQRLAGLALVATQAGADTPERRASRYAQAQEVMKKGMGPIADDLANRLTRDRDLAQRLHKIMMAMQPTGCAGALLGMAERSDSFPMLGSIQSPTVVIAGTEDAIIPTEVALKMAEAIPDCRLVEIAGAGHVPMLECPDQVALALDELIARVEAGRQHGKN